MAEYCTVFAEEAGFAAALAAVRDAAVDVGIEVVGPAESWQRIELRTAGASLRLSSMQYVAGGDRFSHMVLGLYSHFRTAATAHGETGARTLRRISALTFAIGVVADPTMSEEGWIAGVVRALAVAVNGMIFDGETLRSGDGQVLLDAGGGA